MARNDIELKKTDSILDELESIQRAVSRRAYEFFRNRGTPWGDAMSDWLNAERELVWRPAVELRERDGEIEVLAATPGVEAKDLNVQVTPQDLLIKAEVDHEHTPEKGAVQLCEFKSGRLFRSIHFSEPIDPNTVKADYRDGMLRLTAAKAKEPVPARVEVKVA